ncbi:hypothetical protein [uncultured Gammaproteobacteria bacterium]|nr:hypothetical protein [uncultured Gammaproteobacteria bacterium]
MLHECCKCCLFYCICCGFGINISYSHNFNRRHSGLRKEIKVRTPYEALKYWYNLKPDLFIREPDMFRSMVFEGREQRGET